MNKKVLGSILLGALLLVAIVIPIVSLAQTAPAASGKTVDSLSTALRSTFTTIGGAVVFVGWIYAGILYLTAAGKPEKMNVAKVAVIACVIGTLLVILAGASGAIMDVITNAFNLK